MSEVNDWQDVPVENTKTDTDDWQDVAVDQTAAPTEDISQYESAKKGLAQGFTFKSGDEAEGVLGSLLEMLPGSARNQDEELRKQGFEVPDTTSYSAIRDQVRNENKAAEKANPNTYLASEIGGAIANPVNYIPGLGVAAEGALMTRAGLGALAKAGAIQGAAEGLGGSEADLTKGDVLGAVKDTAVGAATGAIAGPVVGAALHGAGKVVSGAKDLLSKAISNTGKFIGESAPSLKTAWEKGAQAVDKSYDALKEETKDRFNKLTQKITDHYEGKTQLVEGEKEALAKEVQDVTDQILKEEAELSTVQGRQKQTDVEMGNVDRETARLTKENDTLRKEAETKSLKQLEELEAAQELEYKNKLKATEEKIKADKKAQKGEINEFDEQYKLDSDTANASAKQEYQNSLFENSEALDTAKTGFQKSLSEGYDKLGEALGDRFSGDDIISIAQKEIAQNEDLSPAVQTQLMNFFAANVPPGQRSLGSVKNILSNLKRLSNSQQDNYAQATVNRVDNLVRQYLQDVTNKANPKAGKILKGLDADWKMLAQLRDFVNGPDQLFQTGQFIQKLQPKGGLKSKEAQKLEKALSEILGDPQTKYGKFFREDYNKIVQAAKESNEDVFASKFNKRLLKQDQERLRLQSILSDLETLKAKDVVPEPGSIEMPAVETPAQFTENEKTIAELTKIQEDLVAAKSRDVDQEVVRQTKLQELEALLSEKKLMEQQYLQNRQALQGSDLVEELVGKTKNQKTREVQGMLGRLRDDTIAGRNVNDQALLNPVKEANVVDEGDLKDLGETLNLFNLDQAALEQGQSLSNRAIAGRLLPRVTYNASQTANQIFNSAPAQVIAKMGGQASKYGKILAEQAAKSDNAYKATLFTLQQQDSEFRKMLKDVGLTGEK